MPSPVLTSVDVRPLTVPFAAALRTVITRDGIPADPALVDAVTRAVVEDGFTSPEARRILRTSGVRDGWNQRFAEVRSRQVAAWVAPALAGHRRVVDLLAGDCRVTRELAARLDDAELLAVEWPEHYDDIVADPSFRFVPWDGGTPPSADAVLLGAVLHHENDPAPLVAAAVATGARTFVVVENCVDETWSSDLHIALDLFFNQTLNEFGSDCVRQHRTRDEWVEYLEPFGRLRHFDELHDVAGLPFPYQLMVFARD